MNISLRLPRKDFCLFLILAIGLPLLTACQSEQPEIAEPIDESAKVAHVCPGNRPEVCNMMYAPVCALSAEGSFSTQSNACRACSQTTTIGYNQGPCQGTQR